MVINKNTEIIYGRLYFITQTSNFNTLETRRANPTLLVSLIVTIKIHYIHIWLHQQILVACVHHFLHS